MRLCALLGCLFFLNSVQAAPAQPTANGKAAVIFAPTEKQWPGQFERQVKAAEATYRAAGYRIVKIEGDGATRAALERGIAELRGVEDLQISIHAHGQSLPSTDSKLRNEPD